MEETDFPNKYKYTLYAGDFVKLFLASDLMRPSESTPKNSNFCQ